jgi:hypothetical protein
MKSVLTKRPMIVTTKMGFTRHRKSIKSPKRIGPQFVEGEIKTISPSLIDLMSFGWLFLGGLLPSRARLRFTSYEDCATLRSADQNGAVKSKTLRLDFFREATNRFRLDFYVRQRGSEQNKCEQNKARKTRVVTASPFSVNRRDEQASLTRTAIVSSISISDRTLNAAGG